MGTDIHWQVEYKFNHQWHWFPPKSKYERFIYSWRSRTVFDILAGVVLAEQVHAKPRIGPRGLPEDMSAGLKAVHDDSGILGQYGFSWLTLVELHDSDLWRYHLEARDMLTTVLPCMQELLTDIPFLLLRDPNVVLAPTELRAVFGFNG